MNTLIDWQGKVEELSLEYDAGVPTNSPLLLAGGSTQDNLPVLVYPVYENIREVEEVAWEEEVAKADKQDCLTAVACGAVSGLIDVFYVGEFSLERANSWGTEQTNKFVKKIAEMNGFKGVDLSDAIRHLEKRFPLAADGKMADFGGARQHHLRDFSHHFSLGGLLCSLFTQFSNGIVIGTDTAGAFRIAKITNKELIGRNFVEKLLFGTVYWVFHIVSDMAGSNSTAGKGTGVPGPILSLLKQLSALPCFRDRKINEVEFHTWVSKLFNGTLLAKRDENGKILEPVKFDLRTEIGILHEVGRQFIPVLINECLVRGIYFVRRFFHALNETPIHSITDLKKLNAADFLPFNNRVIKRMITIASGVFTAVDAVDAVVRAAIKNGGVNPRFFVDFAVRVNIVGIGRFIIACKADAGFITEDIAEARAKRDRIEKEYEKMVADLQCLSLDYDQMRVLYSIEAQIIKTDIEITEKEEERKAKQLWRDEWAKRLLDGLKLAEDSRSQFFLQESEIRQFFEAHEKAAWMYLVAMEARLFVPYAPIFGTDDDKKFKRLRVKSKYLTDVFTNIQTFISKEDIESIKKEHRHAIMTITGSTKTIVLSAVGTTVVIAASGGLAFAFAPAIATALVGEAAAGLSGAALVSYSLAAIGGGSLAAGGLGMAGGTAIITGGGALLGMLGGAGVSTATTVSLLSDDGYVLSECCKLLTYSKTVLLEHFHDKKTISEIQFNIESRIAELEKQLKLFSAKADDASSEQENEKEKRTRIKVAKKCIKYLKNTSNALKKLISEKRDSLSLPEKTNLIESSGEVIQD